MSNFNLLMCFLATRANGTGSSTTNNTTFRIADNTEYLEVQMEMNNINYCKYNKRDPQTSLCKL